MIDLFKKQGWVPATCLLSDLTAKMLWFTVQRGEDPCAGCNHDRAQCKGRPKGGRGRLPEVTP